MLPSCIQDAGELHFMKKSTNDYGSWSCHPVPGVFVRGLYVTEPDNMFSSHGILHAGHGSMDVESSARNSVNFDKLMETYARVTLQPHSRDTMIQLLKHLTCSVKADAEAVGAAGSFLKSAEPSFWNRMVHGLANKKRLKSLLGLCADATFVTAPESELESWALSVLNSNKEAFVVLGEEQQACKEIFGYTHHLHLPTLAVEWIQSISCLGQCNLPETQSPMELACMMLSKFSLQLNTKDTDGRTLASRLSALELSAQNYYPEDLRFIVLAEKRVPELFIDRKVHIAGKRTCTTYQVITADPLAPVSKAALLKLITKAWSGQMNKAVDDLFSFATVTLCDRGVCLNDELNRADVLAWEHHIEQFWRNTPVLTEESEDDACSQQGATLDSETEEDQADSPQQEDGYEGISRWLQNMPTREQMLQYERRVRRRIQ